MKSSQKRSSLSTRHSCPGSNCKDRCCGWTSRNWIHVILLATAVGALVGAVLGSLDSCSSELRNVTTTTIAITPLATSLLLDGSGSMGSDTPTRWSQAIDALPTLVSALDTEMNEDCT
jgi:hypothetical protein